MFSQEKIRMAKEVMWDGISLGVSTDRASRMLVDAYPDIKVAHDMRYSTLNGKIEAVATTGIDNVKDFLDLLKATEPSTYFEEGEKPYYSYETVGANLIRFREYLANEVVNNRVSSEDYLEIYEQIGKFSAISEGVVRHPMLEPRHISKLLSNDRLGIVECLYKALKEDNERLGHTNLNWAFQVFFIENNSMLKPFMADRIDLHREMTSALDSSYKEDRYCVKRIAQNFWNQFPKALDKIKKDNNPHLWRDGIEMVTEHFGLKRMTPFKSSIVDGTAFAALAGQSKMFLEAKRSGYKISTKEYRDFIEPIEKLVKSIGPDWADRIPQDVSKNMSEAFRGCDKKEIIGKKKTENLLPALHRLMPDNGWLELASREKRGKELGNALGL